MSLYQSKLKLFLLFSLLLSIFTQNAFSQNNGSISGKIIDNLTQQPLPSANVSLEGTNIGTATDANGIFRIVDIPLKTYNITFTSIGYKSVTLYNITINAGNENNVTVELEPSVTELMEVVVKADKRTAWKSRGAGPVFSVIS